MCLTPRSASIDSRGIEACTSPQAICRWTFGMAPRWSRGRSKGCEKLLVISICTYLFMIGIMTMVKFKTIFLV
jgi:hypothetical protein